MNILNKFAAVAFIGGVVASACVAAQDLIELLPQERETLENYQRFTQCVDNHRPIYQRATDAFNQQMELHEAYIANRARELARQRADASMHVMIAAALSEGMTEEQADAFVEALVRSDENAVHEQLMRLTARPPAPETPVRHCETRLGLDITVINTRIGQLTRKYGPDILAPSSPFPMAQ